MTHTPGAYYHAASRMIPRCRVPVNVPKKVSTADAMAALGRLRSLYRNSPWADGKRIVTPDGFEETDLTKPPGLDESTGLAMQITAVCRPSLEVAPAFAVTGATVSGASSGKTHLVLMMGALAYGHEVRAFGLSYKEEEREKRLIAAFLSGEQAILFDNCNNMTFHSDTFAAMMTTNSYRARKLGGSDSYAINSRAMVFFTGNHLKFSEDLVRRTLALGLDTRLEDSETRLFPRDSLKNLLAQRGKHLSDVLTIWRWGRQNDKALDHGRRLAGFEKWARWCRDPLLALGCLDPLERMNETRAADPFRARIISIFAAWWAAHGNTVISASNLAESVLTCMHPENRSRQYVAPQVAKLVGTRAGGFVLEHFLPTVNSDPIMYRLTKTGEAAARPMIAGVL